MNTVTALEGNKAEMDFESRLRLYKVFCEQ